MTVELDAETKGRCAWHAGTLASLAAQLNDGQHPRWVAMCVEASALLTELAGLDVDVPEEYDRLEREEFTQRLSSVLRQIVDHARPSGRR